MWVDCEASLTGTVFAEHREPVHRPRPTEVRLGVADEVIMANVFKSDAIPESERLDIAAVATQLTNSGHRARVIADVDGIVRIAAPEMLPGDVVAILSNGGFGGIYEKLPTQLKSLHETGEFEARSAQ